jgi:hypothetical protein
MSKRKGINKNQQTMICKTLHRLSNEHHYNSELNPGTLEGSCCYYGHGKLGLNNS